MIGEKPTLEDIVLTEAPCPIDLYCDEQMPTEEELGSLDKGDSQSETLLQVYVIESRCGFCRQRIRIVVECKHESIIAIQGLMIEDLSFLCPDCYKRQ